MKKRRNVEKGLESWGQDGARIARLKDAADFAWSIPRAVARVSQLRFCNRLLPHHATVFDDPELLSERINTTTTSLLSLVGLDADPLQSQDIFCSPIFWEQPGSRDRTSR